MKTSIRLSLLNATLAASFFSCSIYANDNHASEHDNISIIDVVTFDNKDLNGIDLPQVAPLPKEMVISGSKKNWQKTLYAGQVGIGIWQAEPMKLSVNPQSIDEYIYVLNGQLTITSVDGKVTKFSSGDSLVLPKGFVGTWETSGLYRQLIVVNPSFLSEEH